ncbi:hypothetical protein [Mycobacterium simiae]|uniref:hypothetical protein n=1 Tax=Mycobacterium simiae TaxID=1784 RepID=UPI00261BDA8B|nr:hypothetical protein [Mycobacterium simiae]
MPGDHPNHELLAAPDRLGHSGAMNIGVLTDELPARAGAGSTLCVAALRRLARSKGLEMTIQHHRSDSCTDEFGIQRTGDILGVGDFWAANDRVEYQEFITRLGLNIHAVYQRANVDPHRP